MATLRETFSDIADAIRAKGVTGTMTPLEMPTKIASIPSGGGTVYGMTVQNIIGDVDQNGALVPTSSFSFSPNDIKTVGNILYYKFQANTAITQFLLPKVTTLDTTNAMSYVCYGATNLTKVDLSGVTTINGSGALQNAFRNCTSLVEVDMSGLTTMGAMAGSSFYFTFSGCSALKRVYLTKLSTNAGLMTWSQTFAGCAALELVDFS